MWATGVVLLALGWWGDHEGFWTDRAFVTNVFSSVTAAAFGVPLALVVLSRIGMAQAEAVEARAARRLAGQVAGDFVSSVPRLLLGPSAVLDEAATGLLALERAAQQAIRNWESSQGDAGLTDLRQLLEEGALERALDGFRDAARPGTRAVPAVAEVTAHWSFLNTTVRSRLLETGGPWLAPPLATQIDAYVARLAADPFMDGWLRDLDIAVRRFKNGSDVSTALHELWRHLETGSEVAEALGELGALSREASDALRSPVPTQHLRRDEQPPSA